MAISLLCGQRAAGYGFDLEGSDFVQRTTLVQYWYSANMATRSKAKPVRSVRQSVTMPATLAADVRRVAKGVGAETEAAQQLKAAYRNFVGEVQPERKNEAGRDLIRALF